jgi:hypothetical protein
MQAPRRAGTIKRAKTKRLDADLKQTADCRSLVQRLWTLEDEFPQEGCWGVSEQKLDVRPASPFAKVLISAKSAQIGVTVRFVQIVPV